MQHNTASPACIYALCVHCSRSFFIILTKALRASFVTMITLQTAPLAQLLTFLSQASHGDGARLARVNVPANSDHDACEVLLPSAFLAGQLVLWPASEESEEQKRRGIAERWLGLSEEDRRRLAASYISEREFAEAHSHGLNEVSLRLFSNLSTQASVAGLGTARKALLSAVAQHPSLEGMLTNGNTRAAQSPAMRELAERVERLLTGPEDMTVAVLNQYQPDNLPEGVVYSFMMHHAQSGV